MWKKKKQIVDERIEKESNQLISKQFYVMVLMNVLAMVVKIACKLPFYLYLLEMITLLTMVLYVIIKETSQGILFIKSRDDSVQSIHEGVLAGAYHIAFNIVIAGELLFFVLVYGFAKEYLLWIISYFMIWVPSALWITIGTDAKRLADMGSRKRRSSRKEKSGNENCDRSTFLWNYYDLFQSVGTRKLSNE